MSHYPSYQVMLHQWSMCEVFILNLERHEPRDAPCHCVVVNGQNDLNHKVPICLSLMLLV